MAPTLRRYTCTVDGVVLSVAEMGEGPVLLLLHGLAGSLEVWGEVQPLLAHRHRVIAFDLPGHGESEKPAAPYTIDFFAGIARSVGHALGFDEAIVCGNSLGGQIALELARSYPRFARALVLGAPAGNFLPGLSALGPLLARVPLEVLRRTLPFATRRTFHDPTHPGLTQRLQLLATRLDAPDADGFAHAIAASLAGALAAGVGPLADVPQPVQLVWGREDRLVSIAGSRRYLEELPHARLTVIEQCGHVPMLERPEAFVEAVEAFLPAADAAPRMLPTAAAGGV